MPFDFVKTQAQKENAIKGNTFSIIKTIYNTHGMKPLYIGWQFKMIQYIIQSMFTIAALEHLELRSKKL
jgi:hypothetical protein